MTTEPQNGGLPPEAIEFLRKQHIHFCLPMYGGQCNEATFIAMIKFGIIAGKLGINYSIDTMVNESLITRGRNNLVSKMLFNKSATHLMFIDVDLGFDPEAIIRLMLANQDVVGGVYPMKRVPIRYVINTVPNPATMGDLVEVSTLGTGFMMVKRHVLEKMCEIHPELKYRDNIGIGAQYEPLMFGLFDTMIDEHQNYLSEDWTFCYLWRKAGGKIFADTGIKLDHTGYHKYEGNVEELKKVLTNQITNGGAHHFEIQAQEAARAAAEAAAKNAQPAPAPVKAAGTPPTKPGMLKLKVTDDLTDIKIVDRQPS
jgi:hypothetical protein